MKKHVLFIFGLLASTLGGFSQNLESLELFAADSTIGGINMVRLDNEHNVIISGDLRGELYPGSGYSCTNCAYVAKFDTSGVPIWFYDFGYCFTPPVISIDQNNNTFIAGVTLDSLAIGSFSLPTSTGVENNFLVKIASNGNLVWGKKITENAPFYDMVIDNNGDLIMTGFTRGTSNFTSDTIIAYGGGFDADILLTKFDSLGNFIWAKHYGNPGTWGDYGQDIAIDASNNIFMTGSIRGDAIFDNLSIVPWPFPTPTAGFTSFAAKFDSNGITQWLKPVGRHSNLSGVTTDSAGNCYIGGRSAQDLTSDTATQINIPGLFIAKLAPDGTHLWTRQNSYSGSNLASEIIYDMAMDADGNLYATGQFSDSLTIGNNINLESSNCSSSINNGFLICLDQNGNSVYGKGFKSCTDADSKGQSIDINQCFISVGGRSTGLNGTLYLENDSLTGINGFNAMYFTYDWANCQLTTGMQEQWESPVALYPNPTEGIINIHSSEPVEEAFLTNLNGKILRNYPAGSLSIDVSDFKPGIYLLHLRGYNIHMTKRIIKTN